MTTTPGATPKIGQDQADVGLPGRNAGIMTQRHPTPPNQDSELEAIMARIRSELATRRQAVARSALEMDALPSTYADFAALPEDAFTEAAFRVVLGRPPTAPELEQTGWQMRGKATRAMLLRRMLATPEAKARGATIPGVARRAAIDATSLSLRGSALARALRPALRVGRGLRRLARAAPQLARIEELLVATRQAAVSEQTQRFTSFALQQTEALRALDQRLAVLDGGTPSPTLARALAEAAEEAVRLPPALLDALRAAPGPVQAPAAWHAALRADGLALAAEGAPAGAVLLPADVTLGLLDALCAEAALRLRPGGAFLLAPAQPPSPAPGPATPAAAAPPGLLARLAAAHRLGFEERDGLRLLRWAA